MVSKGYMSGATADYTILGSFSIGYGYLSSSVQLYQDFPKVAAASIRSCLKKFNFHYAPAFEYLNKLWIEVGTRGNTGKKKAGEITLVLVSTPRKKKDPINPKSLDSEFRKELEWIRSKVG